MWPYIESLCLSTRSELKTSCQSLRDGYTDTLYKNTCLLQYSVHQDGRRFGEVYGSEQSKVRDCNPTDRRVLYISCEMLSFEAHGEFSVSSGTNKKLNRATSLGCYSPPVVRLIVLKTVLYIHRSARDTDRRLGKLVDLASPCCAIEPLGCCQGSMLRTVHHSVNGADYPCTRFMSQLSCQSHDLLREKRRLTWSCRIT